MQKPRQAGHMTRDRFLLSSIEAAEYLGLAESTLRQGRVKKKRPGGIATPPFFKIGSKVLYSVEDLDQFLAKHRVIPGGE